MILQFLIRTATFGKEIFENCVRGRISQRAESRERAGAKVVRDGRILDSWGRGR
jgi:hypothetical protein